MAGYFPGMSGGVDANEKAIKRRSKVNCGGLYELCSCNKTRMAYQGL